MLPLEPVKKNELAILQEVEAKMNDIRKSPDRESILTTIKKDTENKPIRIVREMTVKNSQTTS